MKATLAWLFCCGAICALAAGGKPPEARAGNEQVAISATLYADKESIRRELGYDLDGYFIVVKARVTPSGGKKLAVQRDDFFLRSDKDGQKAQPFAPSQIAGSGALVVSETGRGGGMVRQDRGPIWGGYPGTGERPRQLGTDSPMIGSAGGVTSAQATFDAGAKQKESPLLRALKQRVFPDTEVSVPVEGLLYFQLEGKHKPKDLELVYQGPAGKLTLSFRP